PNHYNNPPSHNSSNLLPVNIQPLSTIFKRQNLRNPIISANLRFKQFKILVIRVIRGRDNN
ncbi:MAG: hypothetical protein ABIE92_00695, partial [bacterium]